MIVCNRIKRAFGCTPGAFCVCKNDSDQLTEYLDMSLIIWYDCQRVRKRITAVSLRAQQQGNRGYCKDGTMIPSDPMMLLSFINMKLRDEYDSLDELCESLDLDKAEIIKKLGMIEYRYDPGQNQFK